MVYWPYFAVDVVFFTAIAYSIMILTTRRNRASPIEKTGQQLHRNIATAIITLGCFGLLLDLWVGLTFSFIVNGYCSGNLNSLSCHYLYDYSPLFLPAGVGGALVSCGLLIFYLTTRRGSSRSVRSEKTIRQDSWLNRTGLVVASYIIVPILIMRALLRLGSTWSGFPLVYAGPCGLQIAGDLSWCYNLIWFGFWVDSMFFTALGYASIVLLYQIFFRIHSQT